MLKIKLGAMAAALSVLLVPLAPRAFAQSAFPAIEVAGIGQARPTLIDPGPLMVSAAVSLTCEIE